MFAKFTNLSFRERSILLGGGALAVFILFYTFIWEPWQKDLEQLRSQVPEKSQDLIWMKEQARVIQPLLGKKTNPSNNTQTPLLTLIERSANQVKIRKAIRRISPTENDQVRIWLADADFDQWLRWLETLKSSNIKVTEANIDRSQTVGVSIRVTLQR